MKHLRKTVRLLLLVLFAFLVALVVLSRRVVESGEEPLPETGSVACRGNPGSHVFHEAGCRYFGSKSSTEEFPSRGDALAAGFAPGKCCHD